MEVILREHIDNLGRRGDVVKVAAGYARNYLLPRKLALAVTDSNKRQIERERKVAEVKDAEEVQQATALAQRLEATEIEIARRVGENNTLYGSVTSADIAHALEAKGFQIDKRKITLADPLKALGEVTVPLKIHRDVTAQLKVKVVAGHALSRRRVASDRAAQSGDGVLSSPSPDFFFSTPRAMPDVAAPERTLPHNLDAEKSVLGAILIHNDAFNHAAELIDSKDFFRDAHRRIFDKMVALSERGRCHRLHHAERRADAGRRARRDRRAGLHRGARRRRAAVGQRRVLRADRQGEVDAPQPDPLGQQDSDRGLRGGAGTGGAARRGRAVDLRDCRGTDPRRLRAAQGSRADQLRDDREAAAAARGRSPACRADSPISTR